jgi:hypothetical protein
MFSSSPDYGPGTGDQWDEHPKDSRTGRMDSLAESKDTEHTAMNLPNPSISGPYTPAGVNDGEKSDSQAAGPEEFAQKARYEGLRYSVDMTGGSYKYAGLGLTEKLPGSVARARAEAQRRLQESKTQHVETALPTPYTSASTSKYQVALEKTLRDRAHEPASSTSPYSATAPGANTIAFSNIDYEEPKPGGKWRCCKCQRGHEIFTFAQGQHPVSVLSCACTHRSCSKCILEGLVKQFVPMSEPEVVPLSEDRNKTIRFGVFCEGCGLSWRAEKVQDEVKKTALTSALLRVSAIPRLLTKRGGVHPLERLRPSRSMNNLHDHSELQPHTASLTASKSVLNLRALSNEMQKEHGEQVRTPMYKLHVRHTLTSYFNLVG